VLCSLEPATIEGDIDDLVRELTEDLEVLPAGTYGLMASRVKVAETRAQVVADTCAQEIARIRGTAERQVQAARDLVAESSKKSTTTISHIEHDAEGNVVRAITTKPIPFNAGAKYS
jgi:hypothetical protein